MNRYKVTDLTYLGLNWSQNYCKTYKKFILGVEWISNITNKLSCIAAFGHYNKSQLKCVLSINLWFVFQIGCSTIISMTIFIHIWYLIKARLRYYYFGFGFQFHCIDSLIQWNNNKLKVRSFSGSKSIEKQTKENEMRIFCFNVQKRFIKIHIYKHLLIWNSVLYKLFHYTNYIKKFIYTNFWKC